MHHALRLRIEAPKTFWTPWDIWDVPRGEIVFQAHARVERYETSDEYFAYKMEENSLASEHVLKMSGYNNHLIQLGVNLPDDSDWQSSLITITKLLELRDEL